MMVAADSTRVASAVLRTTVVKSSVGAGLHQIALCTSRRPCQLGFGCYWPMHPGELRMLRPTFARTIRAAAACWEATHARAAVSLVVCRQLARLSTSESSWQGQA